MEDMMEKLVPDPFIKKKMSISLDQLPQLLFRLFETKMLAICFDLI